MITPILLTAFQLLAPPPSAVYLEELTWTEVRDALKAGKTTLIVPTGGTEQNGPHMALGKHNFRIRFTAGRIAARLGNALVAPVMAYVPEGDINPPTSHMRFSGTLTLPDEYFRKTLEFAARSAKLHGFTNIVFIGDSGPNQPGMQAVAAQLNTEWKGAGARVHFIPEYYSGTQFEDWLAAQGETREAIGTHAGIKDTALLLAIDPKLIRKNKLANNGGSKDSGVTGDPTRATVAYGKKGIEMLIDATVANIQKSIADPAPPPAALPLSPAEKLFQESLTRVTLNGFFTMGNASELKQDRYVIERISKAAGNLWKFDVKIQYGGKNLAVSLPIPIEWAGDTPVVVINNFPVPGSGTFTARVLFHNNAYTGTWSAADGRGGKLFGSIEKI